MNRFSVTSMLTVCCGVAFANAQAAAPNEGPAAGYYRIERATRLRPAAGLGTLWVETTLTNKEGVLTREDRAATGVASQQQFASPPEFRCVTKMNASGDWRKILLDICKASGGGLCRDEQSVHGARSRVQGQDVWEVSYPLSLDGGGPSGVTQLRSAMSDPRIMQGMSPAEREKIRAGMAQLPSSAEMTSTYEKAARIAEESAAKEDGWRAEKLRETAQRLRAGHAGGLQGENVERWVRVADSCPGR